MADQQRSTAIVQTRPFEQKTTLMQGPASRPPFHDQNRRRPLS